MNIQKYLEDYSVKYNLFLSSYLSKKTSESDKIDTELSKLHLRLQNYCIGGKYLRGGLTQLGYQIAGGAKIDRILPVSCGIELFHNYLLIHDDIVDNDVLRRGKPTVHKEYADEKNSSHYGISKAIILGDLSNMFGLDLILRSDFPKQVINKALLMLNDMLVKTAYGEILDMDYDFLSDIAWDHVLRVRKYKTAYYTFVMPMSVGAILGEASMEQLNAIEDYGMAAGIAFQIHDDLLGIFGNPEITGKSNESDIRDGKKTFLYAKTLELLDKENKEEFRRLYGGTLDLAGFKKVRNLIETSLAKDYSEKLEKELAKKSLSSINGITVNPEYREVLSSLSRYIITRNK